MKQHVTIKDVAKVAGVNHSTVSRSLNGSDVVAVETRERIKRIAAEMGYSPNSFARKLITRKSNTLGVFFLSRDKISFMENFGTQFLDGIAQASDALGYDLLFFTMTRESSVNRSYIQLCWEKHVEGVIFIGVTSDDPHLGEICQSSIPVSIIDFKIQGNNAGFISTDNVAGVNMAMDYLWSKGHRDIAFIGGPEVSQVAEIRESTFRAYQEARGAWDPQRLFRGNYTKSSGYEQALAIMKQPRLPTAVFTVNDYMALGAIKAFKEYGIRVPSDISVVGFDDIYAGEVVDPALTTINQNPVEMGTAAVRYLTDTIDGKNPVPENLISPRLVVRESVRKI